MTHSLLMTIFFCSFANLSLANAHKMPPLKDASDCQEMKKEKFTMVSLGASESVAYDAGFFGWNYALSWATGYEPFGIVNSHYKRLEKALCQKVGVH